MKNLNAEQIKYALDCCTLGDCYPCPYGDIGAGCRDKMSEDALALLNSQEQKCEQLSVELDAMRGAANSYKMHNKKLTEENEAWQKQLIATEEKSDKAYYDLACEVEDLRTENESLHASCTELTRNLHECKADTVRKMQEKLKRYYDRNDSYLGYSIAFNIDRVAKEMLEETNEKS